MRHGSHALWLVLVLASCTAGDEVPARVTAGMVTPELQVFAPTTQVGFDTDVELKARIEPDDGRGRWSIAFEHIWGPKPRRATSKNGLFRYRTPPPPKPTGRGILPLGAAAAGRQVFSVTARSAGHQLRRTVQVFPALPTAGWPRMAVGVDCYLRGESLLWEGDLSIRTDVHPGLSIIRAEKPGQFQIRPHAAKERGLILRAGRWLGNKDCGRIDCHPDEHQGWLTTAHATVFTRGISGELPLTFGKYQEHCLPCHTLGYQPGAYNDGFDELQQSTAWRFPERLTPSAWRRLPEKLRERANVQCESCHGPAWFYVGYGVDICAQCHDAPPRYRVVQQLRGNRMFRAERSLADRKIEPQNCQQCHMAGGFLHSLRGHRSTSRPDLDLDTTPRGVTCAACHDPHDRGCFRQLRLCGTVEVPGLTFDAGQGALCISCHNNESDVVQGQLVRPFIPGKPRPRDMAGHGQTGHGQARDGSSRSPLAAPHAPQFQLVTSRGGKFLELPKQLRPSKPNPHMFVPDSCVGCHYDRTSTAAQSGGHTFRLAPGIKRTDEPLCSSRLLELNRVRESRHTRPCQSCHGSQKSLNVAAKGDYDGDGKIEGIVDEILGLLQILAGHIADQAEHENATVVIVDEKVALADEGCRPLRIPLETRPQLYKAAYNLMLVLRDGSGGIHNPWYTVRLLQQTIEHLDRAVHASRPRPRSWMRR